MAEYEEFEVEYLGQTAKAVKVNLDGAETWLPKAVLELEGEEFEGAEELEQFDIGVARWFARKEGLI